MKVLSAWLVAAVAAVIVAGLVLPNGLPFGVVVLGIVLGALQALTALGIVLLYRSSRVINLAQAEIGGLAASAAVILVAGSHLSYFLAVPLGLLVAAATGALIDATVVRRLFTAPRLIVMVATIGLAQLLGAAEIFLPHLWGHLKPFTTFHAPGHVTWRIGPLVFGPDHLVAVIAAAVALVGLWQFLVRSRTGIAIRAAADSQERAALLGIPVRRLSLITWIVAAVLSGMGAMLSAPILGAQVGVAAGPVALLIPLAAAVLGRMDDLVRTAFWAVVLSVYQQAVFWSWPRSSVVDVGLFGAVLVGLLAQRRAFTREGDVELGAFVATRQARPLGGAARLPEVRLARVAFAGVVLLGVASTILWGLSASQLVVATYIAIYGIVAISLVVLTGWAGQISLGQFAFVAVGAAAVGGLYVGAGVDFFLAALVATLVGAAAAVIIGVPALRLPGPMLAVATLAFAVPVSTWLLNPSNFASLTPASIPRPRLLGHVDLAAPRTFALVCWAVTLVAWMLMGNLRRSRTGRAIIGVRDNERGAASFAIDPTRIRLAAAAVAGGLCGLAGALYAVALRGVGFAGFDPAESIQAFTMVVVGGLGSLGTAVLGALYVRGAEYELQGALQLLATGAGLLVLLLWVPGGLGSIAIGIRDRFVRWAAARHGTALDLGVAAFRPDASTGARPVEDAFLRVDRLDAGYGPVQVLFGASLGVRRGEILALVGTNGAGKSTLLGVVAGLRPAAGGGVWLDGQRLRGDAAARARAGVSLMPGGKAVFASLTVAENLRVAGWLRRAPAADVLMLFPALQARMGTRAGLLSGGEQQMLGMAMSLLAGPDLLLIDELSLGLAPTVVAGLLDAVKQINAAGTTVVIVEQSINVAATLAEDAAFLERGTVRFAGPTRELLDRGDLARAVFLRPPSRRAPATGAGAAGRTGAAGGAGDGSAALAVEHVSVAFGGVTAVGDVSLSVGHGSIVGLIGSNGAGKTTLLDALSGFVNVRSGHIDLGGSDVTGLPPAARARRGLGRSFQGARLFPSLTVTETLALACERQVSVRDPIAASLRLKAARGSERAVWARVEALVEQHHLGPFRDAFISELSTGTRRIVELACAFAHQPSVLLLDEPSSGLAQREAEALSDVLAGLRASLGAALLIVEHDIPLVAGLADELVCLHHGSVLAAGRPDDVLAHPAVVAACLGADDRTVTRSGRRSRARPTPRSADEVRPV